MIHLTVLLDISIWVPQAQTQFAQNELIIFLPHPFFLRCFPSQHTAPISAQFIKSESWASFLTSLLCSPPLYIQSPNPPDSTPDKKHQNLSYSCPSHCIPNTGHNDLLPRDHFNNRYLTPPVIHSTL